MLTRFPFELIRAILAQLPSPDLDRISRCSKQLNAIAIPLLYSKLDLDLILDEGNQQDYHIDPDLLHLLVEDERRYGRYVRQIRVWQTGKVRKLESTQQKASEVSAGNDDAKDETPIEEASAASEDEDNGSEYDSDNEDGGGRISHVEAAGKTTREVSKQFMSILESDDVRLTKFQWFLEADLPEPVFERVIHNYGASLTTLKVGYSAAAGSPSTLPADSLPNLRKLSVCQVYSPRRVVELHYLLCASPHLESFAFSFGYEVVYEASDYTFSFEDSETADLVLEAFEWEEPPTHWVRLLETCVFKNLQRYQLKKLKLENLRLTAKMASYLHLESIRELDFRRFESSVAFFEAIDPSNMLLHKCNLSYSRIAEVDVFHEFLGAIKPGLRHLGYHNYVANGPPGPPWTELLEDEFPGILSLPEGLIERQKDSLETLVLHIYNVEDTGEAESDDEDLDVPEFPTKDLSVDIPREFSILTELALAFQLQQAFPEIQHGSGTAQNAKHTRDCKCIDKRIGVWTPLPIKSEKIPKLPRLRVLTLIPTSPKYREEVIENTISGGQRSAEELAMNMEILEQYVKDTAGIYEEWYTNIHCLGQAAAPPLEWVIVVGGGDSMVELGYRITWVLEGERYIPSVQMVKAPHKTIFTEDMRLRKYGIM